MKKRVFIMLIILSLICISGLFYYFNYGRVNLSESEAKRVIQESFEQFLNYKDDNNRTLLKAVKDNFKVEVQKIRRKDDDYVVTCMISNHNLAEAIESTQLKEETTLTKYNQLLSESFNKASVQSKKMDVAIIKDENGNLVAKFTEDQVDIATGGMISYFNNLVKQGDE